MAAPARSWPGARALAAALLCAAPGLAAAQADEPGAPEPAPAPRPAGPADDFPPQYEWPVAWPEQGWWVTLKVTMGGGWDWSTGDRPGGVAAGFGLLVRNGEWGVEPFLHGGGGDAHQALWYGLAAGRIYRPAPWVRVELLGEVGGHDVGLDSEYAGLPTAWATLPFLGLRAAAYTTLDTLPSAMNFGARRLVLGLQVAGRTDLGTAVLSAPVPPELGAAPPQTVGGPALSIALVLALEW